MSVSSFFQFIQIIKFSKCVFLISIANGRNRCTVPIWYNQQHLMMQERVNVHINVISLFLNWKIKKGVSMDDCNITATYERVSKFIAILRAQSNFKNGHIFCDTSKAYISKTWKNKKQLLIFLKRVSSLFSVIWSKYISEKWQKKINSCDKQ